jgi:flagellar biosynthetic protein FliQ
MNADQISYLIKMCLVDGFMVILPIAVVTLIIGVTVSVFQTITSVQEQTLTFVPKLVGAAFCIWLLGPWMISKLGNMMLAFFQHSGDVLR